MTSEPAAVALLPPSDPPSPWPFTIPQSKLRPGANPPHLIRRPRLFALIQEPELAALTLVVAPAGAGKTSLLRSWVVETSRPHAWLSLDETDRDPVQFWLAMLAALEHLAPGCADPVLGVLRRPGGVAQAVTLLVDDLAGRAGDERVLVIDDLHLIDDVDAVSAPLALFLQQVPAWLRVVIASRRSPQLPTHRLRAHGQLTEVTFTELRFSPSEATDLLARIAPRVAAEQADEIARRSGGWAASLQLAALAARSKAALSEADPPVSDAVNGYLQEFMLREVLAHEPQELVEVLMTTAVVERISPGLGEVLSGRDDATELLALACRRGLFVTQIEPAGSFEVHRLVREILMHLAARRWPGRLAGLHASAAEWFEARGEVLPALDHWLRGERPEAALRLLSRRATTLYDAGHESVILQTIEAIPPATAATDMDTMLGFAWCHLLVDRQRFLRAVDQVGTWAEQEAEPSPLQSARLGMLQAIAATMRGDWSAGQSALQQALRDFGSDWHDDYLGSFAWVMRARGIALDERWSDEGPEVRAVAAALSVTPERRIAFEGVRAVGEALAGRPVDALRVVAGVREIAEVAKMTILRSELDIAEAIALREIGEGRAALPRLHELSEIGQTPVTYAALLARAEVTQAMIEQGDLDAAEAAFARVAETVEADVPGVGGRDWLARAGCGLALAEGHLAEAREWASRPVDPFWAGVCAARVLLAEGDRASAKDALAAITPRCLRHEVIRSLLLAQASDRPLEADQHLGHAVQLAAANGMVATVAAEGPAVLEAVERLAWRAPQNWLDRLRRSTAPTRVSRHQAALGLIDTLTPRELEVLRLLPSRLSLREVADELFISMNTLKFHLKVIYRKLNCASRAEAAEMARSMTSPRHPVSRGLPGDAGSRTAPR